MTEQKAILIDLLDRFMEQTFEDDVMKAQVMLKWKAFKEILGQGKLDHGKAFAFIRELTEEMTIEPKV